MDHPDNTLEKSFIETVANSDLKDVAQTTAEVAVDSFLNEGLLRDVPLIGLALGVVKAGVSIRERLFIAKVLRFLKPLSRYTVEERRNYLASLDHDELNNASQYMMLYLDRLDSLEKPAMLAKIFEAYMLQKITYKTMLYFTHFVDSVFILVWQDYHRAIKLWHDHEIDRLQINEDDALALEKVGFYKEEHKGERQALRETLETDTYGTVETVLADWKRRLVLTNAGWDFIQVVFQLWTTDRPDQPHPVYYRSQLSVELKHDRF